MRSERATVLSCLRVVVFAAPGRLRSYARKPGNKDSRMSSSHLLDSSVRLRGSLRPLLVKELWEILGGRALWTMLLILCPLVGYSFIQAVALYSEASSAALQSTALASGLSPLDGVLVPT